MPSRNAFSRIHRSGMTAIIIPRRRKAARLLGDRSALLNRLAGFGVGARPDLARAPLQLAPLQVPAHRRRKAGRAVLAASLSGSAALGWERVFGHHPRTTLLHGLPYGI